jgi:hypothetical protein
MSESKPKELTKEKYEQRINDEFQQSVNPKMGYSEWAKLKESYLKAREKVGKKTRRSGEL